MAKRSKRRSPSSTPDTDALFKSGEPSEGYSNLPKGPYEGYIKPESATIEPKESGGHRARLTLIATAPEEFVDKPQTARWDLSTQTGVDIFLGVIKILDLGQPKSVRACADLLPETDGLPVRFYVTAPKDENPPNVYINELLEGGKHKAEKEEEPEEPDEPEAPADENWTAEAVADLSEKEMITLAEEEGLDPDDYTWEELEAQLVDILC